MKQSRGDSPRRSPSYPGLDAPWTKPLTYEDGAPIITIRMHDVDGKVGYEYRDVALQRP